MEERLRLVKALREGEFIDCWFQGYGYEVKTTHRIGDSLSRDAIVRPVRYKTPFHFDVKLQYLPGYGITLENANRVLEITHEDIDLYVESLRRVQKLHLELLEREEDLFPDVLPEADQMEDMP